MSSRPRILCAMPEGAWRRMRLPEFQPELEALGDVTLCCDGDPHALSEHEYGGLWERAEAVVTGWGVRPPTAAMLDRARDLRIICHTAGSVRMLPRYALERGIVVTSARAGIARTVAEFCLLNAILLLRRYAAFVDTDPARRAALAPEGGKPANETLFGKTVGLVGFGEVGRRFRELLRPFGCPVVVADPYLSAADARTHDVERAPLDDLLRRCRVVSLHAPDVPETRGMIGARELALLPDGAVFLNSARGRLVDTEALTAALQTGRLLAAIDVTDPEPLPADHPLRFLPNVIFTPHVAGPTDDDLPAMTRMALTDLRRFLQGEPPLYPISLEAYDRMSF